MRRPTLVRIAISIAGCALMFVPLVASAANASSAGCTKITSGPSAAQSATQRTFAISGCRPAALLGGGGTSVINVADGVTLTRWSKGKGTTIVVASWDTTPRASRCPDDALLVVSNGTVTGGSGDALDAIEIGETFSARYCATASTLALEPGSSFEFVPAPVSAAASGTTTTNTEPTTTTTTTTRPTTTTTRPPRTTTTRRTTTTTQPPTTTAAPIYIPPAPAPPPPLPPPPPPPPPPAPGAVPAGLSPCPGDAVSAMVALVNRDRANTGGLPPLAINGALNSAAHTHSVKMAQSGTLTHDGWDTEIANSGFAPGPPGMTGQNVAMRSGGYSPDAIESMFFNETPPNDGHRQSILNPNFHQIGVGCVLNPATGVYWWTQDFGS